MALIKCPECGKEISDKANNCPNCGFSPKDCIICEECGCRNKKGAKSCTNCGFPFDDSYSPASPETEHNVQEKQHSSHNTNYVSENINESENNENQPEKMKQKRKRKQKNIQPSVKLP